MICTLSPRAFLGTRGEALAICANLSSPSGLSPCFADVPRFLQHKFANFASCLMKHRANDGGIAEKAKRTLLTGGMQLLVCSLLTFSAWSSLAQTHRPPPLQENL